MSTFLRNQRDDRGGRRYQPFFRRLVTREGPQEFSNFRTTVWRFGTEITEPVNLTLTHDSTQDEINQTYDTISQLLTGSLERVMADSNYPNGLVHLALDIHDSGFHYNFSPAGSEGVTLNALLNEGRLIDVIDEISNKIQSGKDVVLNNNSELTVYLYQNIHGGMRVREANKGMFMEKCRSIVRIFTPPNDYSCAARALCAGKAKLTLNDKQFKTYRTLLKRTQHSSQNEREALTLLEAVGLDRWSPAGLEKVGEMANHLGVSVHVLDITNRTKPEFVYHYPELADDNDDSLPKVYLVLNNDHYNTVTNVQGFMRAFTNNNRSIVCSRCHHVYSDQGRRTHVCDFSGDTKRRKVTHYRIRYSAVDVEAPDEYIDTLTPKPPSTRKILYFDVETRPVGVHKETGEEEPVGAAPDISWYNVHSQYHPAPWVPRPFLTEYKYKQVVYLVIVQNESGEEHRFSGDNAMKDFMTFLNLPDNKDAILIGHYASGFDSQFLVRETLCGDYLCFGKDNAPLLRGQKIVTAKIINGIKLLDSYNFMGVPLSSFPKVFDLDANLSKGFFPHSFARKENMLYKGPIVSPQYYDPDQMKPGARTDFFKWFDEQVENKVEFDFMKDCETYCSMDVTLLRQGMTKLRELFLNMKDSNDRAIGIDIMQSATIPSVCYKVFRTYFLKENTICKIQPPARNQYSAKQIMWMDYVMQKENIFIQHALNGGEVRIRCGRRHSLVDGFCEETDTIYSFLGCWFHGCSFCFDGDTLNTMKQYTFEDQKTGEPVTKNVRMAELLMQVEEQNNRFRAHGHRVIVMWECQWDALVKANNLPKCREELLHREPLNPRDSYYGGRTETIECYREARGNERFHYVDVTSMYPSVMRDSEYPVGPPTVLKKHRDVMIPVHQLFGVAKVKISSPEHMHLPFLPIRSENGKIKFGLGTFVGTYTSIELQHAVDLGYVIHEWYEQWHYPGKSGTLFREYINTFFEMKKKAKEEGNNGMAALSKLLLNSMYGKLAESSANNKQTKIINTYEDLSSLLFGKFKEVAVNLVNERVGYATITKSQTVVENPSTNVLVASFITSYARSKLYMEGYHVLQDKMMYADTDSLIYRSPNGEHLIPLDTDGELGLWTSELEDEDDFFYSFVSSGPKSYALLSVSEKGNMVKQKGFSLHYRNSQLFNFEKLKEQVIAKALGNPLDKMVLHKNEMIMRRNMFELIVENNKGKMINLVFDKREMQEPLVDEEGNVYCVTTQPVHI